MNPIISKPKTSGIIVLSSAFAFGLVLIIFAFVGVGTEKDAFVGFVWMGGLVSGMVALVGMLLFKTFEITSDKIISRNIITGRKKEILFKDVIDVRIKTIRKAGVALIEGAIDEAWVNKQIFIETREGKKMSIQARFHGNIKDIEIFLWKQFPNLLKWNKSEKPAEIVLEEIAAK